MIGNQRGFTLLEVMIAFAIMVVIITAVFTVQGGGLASSGRNKNIMVATHLARNLINEEELKYEGVPFDNLPEKRSDSFEGYKGFKYTVEYKKVDFSALTDLFVRAMSMEKEKGGSVDENAGTVMRVFKEYLEKSVRRMTVTIEFEEGTGTSTQTFTQLLVNYDAEMSLTI